MRRPSGCWRAWRTGCTYRWAGCGPEEVAALAAALTAGPLDDEAVQRLYQGTGGHPLYLRTVLSEGSGFDPRAPGRLALPRSLAAAIGDHLRVLPPDTRVMLEMLAVLNLRLPLAQLGQAAEVGSPSAAIEPAVAAGLVDWWPEEPTCPVAIRHLLVRDAIYAGITAHQAPRCCTPAPSRWSASRHRGSTGWPPWTARTRAWPASWSALADEEAAAGRWRWPPPTCSGPRTSPRPGPTGNGGC